MKEIIENNAKIGREEYKRLIKRNQRKERKLSIFLGIFIVVTTCLLLILNSKLTNDAQKNCINAGHSENYCVSHL